MLKMLSIDSDMNDWFHKCYYKCGNNKMVDIKTRLSEYLYINYKLSVCNMLKSVIFFCISDESIANEISIMLVSLFSVSTKHDMCVMSCSQSHMCFQYTVLWHFSSQRSLLRRHPPACVWVCVWLLSDKKITFC